MKHDQLRSIAHNIADSFASGIGLLAGYFQTDVYGEAAKNPNNSLNVDFLKGIVIGDYFSESLSKAVRLYSEALPEFFAKHCASISDVKEFIVTYQVTILDNRATVNLTDFRGRTSSDEYHGTPLQRVKSLDSLGRIRTQR